MLIPECPLSIGDAGQPEKVPVALLAEEFRPDVASIELGWNVLDADLALLYYVAKVEEAENHWFRRRAVGLVPGHVQSRSVVDVDRDAL